MTKCFSILLTLFFMLNLHADESKAKFFRPKLYESLWPDFCLDHLTRFPLECSEQYLDNFSDFYVEHLEQGNSEAYIDREIIFRLASYSNKIPKTSKNCDFLFCQQCHAPVVRGLFETESDNSEAEIDEDIIIDDEISDLGKSVCYTCKCIDSWHDKNQWEEDGRFIKENWTKCKTKAIPYQYFDIHAKESVPFLEQHLKYSQENPKCLCYWPYRSKTACEISDLIYDEMLTLSESSSLSKLTSQKSKEFPYVQECFTHSVFSDLFIHAFFYSQYRQILLKLALWQESHAYNDRETTATLNSIYHLLDRIQVRFLNLYSECLTQHPHPKIYYERGMIYLHQGKTIDSLDDIRKLIDWANNNHHEELLTSDLYFQEGSVYAELGLYDKAVESLSQAIEKDPTHKNAYFERAVAYFELGQFELALNDYLTSGIKPQRFLTNLTRPFSFSVGLHKGILNGQAEAAIEFIPSLLATFHGISQGLWALAQDPVQVSKDFVDASSACIDFIREHTIGESLLRLAPELRELIEKWDVLEEEKRGETIGLIIGKYGVDIFAGAGISKMTELSCKLKKANNLLTLEAMAISERNNTLIKLEAVSRAQARKEILKRANLTIEWDKQGKHILGHKNYFAKDLKSIFAHSDPQRLLRDFAGKGLRNSKKIPGSPGYKEVVDFGEFIGYSIDPNTGEKIATTWGKIHYSKDGVHIVPTKPR